MKTRMALIAVLGTLLATPVPSAAGVFAFGALTAPAVVQAPCPLGGGFYAPPAYYPPAYPYYGYPYYAVPAVPYGYPLGYRGAWRTDYPWWSPGPRGYRWH